MSRFKVLALAEMTAEQRRIADRVLAVPGRSLAHGPWNFWMRSPELAHRLLEVGQYVRFQTSLPGRLNELAILVTARAWTAQFEWHAHYPMALKAGLAQPIADAIRVGRRPEAMQDDEAAVYDFCSELHRDRRVADETFARAVATLGEQAVMDLVGVCGFYDLVSMTLNVAEVPLPGNAPPPLATLPG
jgi:4-carboxymuconolactone decarboxylase